MTMLIKTKPRKASIVRLRFSVVIKSMTMLIKTKPRKASIVRLRFSVVINLNNN